tara:strand:- start:820 stop:1575 length:756 start_codon:yes stop_codon:yes gene_type:complete
MSIKSLLQLILLFLIILVLGGIYFLYFYESPRLNVDLKPIIENSAYDQDNSLDDVTDREILGEIGKKDENNIIVSNKNLNTESIKIKDVSKNYDKPIAETNFEIEGKLEEIKNLTKEIEYVTSNKNGDIYKISAKYGKTNLKNTSILDLEQVVGTITSTIRSEIYITSDYAKYNYTNQNSKFFDNVEIKYDEKIIYCDNFEIKINKNIAIAYGNVLVKDKKSQMKAQTIVMDIVTKDLSINSSKEISIMTN